MDAEANMSAKIADVSLSSLILFQLISEDGYSKDSLVYVLPHSLKEKLVNHQIH